MSRRRTKGEGGIDDYATAGGTRWRASWREPIDFERPELGKRQRSSGGHLTKELARAALREALGRVDAGTPTAVTKDSFGAYAMTWLATRRVEEATFNTYHRLLTLHAIPSIGATKISAIRPSTLAGLYRQLERSGSRRKGSEGAGLGPNTIRKVHDAVRSVLDAAVEDGLISSNPARREAAAPPTTREVRRAKPEMVVWTPAQVRAYLRWLRSSSDTMRYMFSFVALTGVRRGEALALAWKDLDLKRGTAVIRRATTRTFLKGQGQRIKTGKTKSDRERVIDLDDATIADLKAQRRLLSTFDMSLVRADALVFVDPDGSTIKPDRALDRFKSTQRRYNAVADPHLRLPELALHSLRHTHASNLLAAGVHPKIVQERLGHATIAITLDLYSHSMPTTQRNAVAALARLLSEDDGDESATSGVG